MVVAVRLFEFVTLVAVLAFIGACCLVIAVADKFLLLFLYILAPVSAVLHAVTTQLENTMVFCFREMLAIVENFVHLITK